LALGRSFAGRALVVVSAAVASAGCPEHVSNVIAPTSGGPGPTEATRGTSGECPESYVRIPAGTFTMGSADGEGEADEHPQHPVTVAGFCMKTTEVTVHEYEACVRAGGCETAPSTVDWPDISGDDAKKWSAFCNGGKPERADHPINCIDWNQAGAYCRWAGGRLPTEEEWEYAARGTDGRTYPWGNDAPSDQLCWTRASGVATEWEGTCSVGANPRCDSPFGLHDMAGNVGEWTSTIYCAYDGSDCSAETRVYRGGSWDDTLPLYVSSTFRLRPPIGYRYAYLGVRCAR